MTFDLAVTFGYYTEATIWKEIIDKFNFIKIKIFFSVKGTVQGMER
jgi:hypothetical protein